jgi:Flp pilus assembly protein TadG
VRPSKQPNQRQRGAVMIWMALFLLGILGFVALGIDTAKVAATRTQLQNAADAAALAGASAIDFETGDLKPDTATAKAQAVAFENKAFVDGPQPVTVAAADVTFPNPNECKVVVRRTAGLGGEVVTHIAQVLGIKSLSLNATATARVEPLTGICEGVLPMAPVEPPVTGFLTGCANEYNLKVGAGEGQQGNYELLDFADCDEGPCADVGGGGAEIRCLTENGYGCCIRLGDEFVLTQPGNKVGPFRQGMQARWDADTDRRENICYSEYIGNGKRVVHVPGVESFDVNGKKYVRITGFYAFFLKRRPTGGGQQTLIGEFLHDVAPGEPGGGSSEGTLFTIRLVQ